MTDYQPIDCELHSQYELAVMRASALRLSWRDSTGITHSQRLVPTDLRSRKGEEFLVALNAAGDSLEIRLDPITGMESP